MDMGWTDNTPIKQSVLISLYVDAFLLEYISDFTVLKIVSATNLSREEHKVLMCRKLLTIRYTFAEQS